MDVSQLPELAVLPLLAQLELLDLARTGQRHRLDGKPVARRLVRGEMPAHVVEQLLAADPVARRRANERRDHLSPPRVRQTDHGYVADARMLEQQFLELFRVDVLAAADDHVLDATL